MEKKDRLVELRKELEQIDPEPWSEIIAWAARARVIFRSDWPELLTDLQELTKEPKWLQLPRVGGGGSDFNIRAAATERNVNNGKALGAKKALLGFLDAILSTPSSTSNSKPDQRFDVLILTVNRHEYDAIVSLARASSGVDPAAIHLKRTYYDLGTIGGVRVALVRSEMGSTQPGAATTTTLQAMSDLKPTYIIAVGIMFGIDPAKQKLGHVLYSGQLQNYELQRIGTDEHSTDVKITPRGDKVKPNPRFLSRVKDAADNWPGDPGFGRPEDVLLLSGEKLVDNIDYRQQLSKLFPEAKGGEMEASGIYSATREEETLWMVIKAVSDYADGKKRKDKDKRQILAAGRAARFTFYLLERGGLAPI